MAFRFGDSFSHYSTSMILQKWTTLTHSSGGNVTINATGGRTGAGSLVISTSFFSPTYAQKTLDNQSTWTVGAAINFVSGDNYGIIIFYDGSTRQMGLAVNTNGTLYIDKNGTAIATSSNAIAAGWHYCEIQAVFNGSSGSVTVNIDNTTWISYSGNISQSGNDRANGICLGDWLGPSSGPVVNYCDLYINDGTGSTNNTFWGDIRAVALLPTGNGYYTSFTAVGAGSAYQAVNDNPPDDNTSFIQAAASGTRASFTFPTPSDSIVTALALQTVIDAEVESAGSRSIAASLRMSGTDYDGATVSLSTNYVFYCEPRGENPATSAAWGSTDFNSLEAGLEIVS